MSDRRGIEIGAGVPAEEIDRSWLLAIIEHDERQRKRLLHAVNMVVSDPDPFARGQRNDKEHGVIPYHRRVRTRIDGSRHCTPVVLRGNRRARLRAGACLERCRGQGGSNAASARHVSCLLKARFVEHPTAIPKLR